MYAITQTMDRKKFAFDKMNFIWLAAGMAVVIIGFLLIKAMPARFLAALKGEEVA